MNRTTFTLGSVYIGQWTGYDWSRYVGDEAQESEEVNDLRITGGTIRNPEAVPLHQPHRQPRHGVVRPDRQPHQRPAFRAGQPSGDGGPDDDGRVRIGRN